MSKIKDIIEEQLLLLHDMGYNDKGLNSSDADNSVKEQLSTQISLFLDIEDELIGDYPFQIHLLGQYDGGKDKVLFTFFYSYDSLLSQLTLNQVEARLNNVPITIQVSTGTDLWTSKEMYQRVKPLSDTINVKIIDELNLKRTDLLNSHIAKLEETGYKFKSILNSLENTISKLKGSEKTHHFIIKSKYSPDEKSKVMQIGLHYQYNEKFNQLLLKSVKAGLPGVSKVFIGTWKHPVPPAPDIYEYLKELQPNKLISKRAVDLNKDEDQLTKKQRKNH